MCLRWLLEATISFDIATFFIPVKAISKCTLSPYGPCTRLIGENSLRKEDNIYINLIKREKNALETEKNVWSYWMLTSIVCTILQTFCPQWPIPLLIRRCSQDRWSHLSVQPLAIQHQEYRGPWMDTPCRKMIGKLKNFVILSKFI